MYNKKCVAKWIHTFTAHLQDILVQVHCLCSSLKDTWLQVGCRNAATKNRNLSKVQNCSSKVKYCFTIAHSSLVLYKNMKQRKQTVSLFSELWTCNLGDCRRYYIMTMNTAEEDILYLKHWILMCCEIKVL